MDGFLIVICDQHQDVCSMFLALIPLGSIVSLHEAHWMYDWDAISRSSLYTLNRYKIEASHFMLNVNYSFNGCYLCGHYPELCAHSLVAHKLGTSFMLKSDRFTLEHGRRTNERTNGKKNTNIEYNIEIIKLATHSSRDDVENNDDATTTISRNESPKNRRSATHNSSG